MRGLLVLLLVVAGCAGDDPDYAFDFDGDGWDDGVDCEPDDPAISPGADEICDDGIDNDCDGLLDFDDEPCNDLDGDGADYDVDCNPDDPTIHPGADQSPGSEKSGEISTTMV